jgi:hypothetical protein
MSTGIKVSASAVNGQSGTWLLDPADVTISSAATSGGTLSGNVFTPDDSASTANINVATIESALTAGTNVTILTDNVSGTGQGDITVNAPVSWTKADGIAPASTLTLTAVQDVVVNEADHSDVG